MKSRLAFISNMAAPYQVKFCYALQEYIETEFWFYVQLEPDRPKWWEIPLGDSCKILKVSSKLPVFGYFSLGVYYELFRYKPSVILLDGFMKQHLILLWLAKMLNKKVIIMSEPIRYVKKETSGSSDLLSKENSPFRLKMARRLFSSADLYMGMGDVAAKQFIEEFEFPEEKVIHLLYPIDIDEYFNHPLRVKEKGDPMRILFANRLIERYQPLFALEAFKRLSLKHPNLEMYLNSEGHLKEACVKFIEDEQLKNVHFLDEITSWNEMHLVYKEADILVLPASYSNGNGTILEAMASGMGVVISDKVNHFTEHALNGKNSFVCELKMEKFIESIEQYIEHPEILISHGQLSRKIIEHEKNEYLAKVYYEKFKKHGLIT